MLGFGASKKCGTGDGKLAARKVEGIPYCTKHANQIERMGGQSEAKAGRPGKAATTRKRNQER